MSPVNREEFEKKKESLCVDKKSQKDKRQNIAAEKMSNFSEARFSPLTLNDCVALGLAKVDQRPLDFNRIKGIITDFKNNVYQTGTIQ